MNSTTARWRYLPLFLIACFAVSAFGAWFPPDAWYESLNRAPWTPPNIAFPIVWTTLYAIIAVVGWRIFATQHKDLKALWLVQLLANASWSWVFFGCHLPLLGLAIILTIAGLVATLIWRSYRKGLRLESILLLPYLTWLCLAASLNSYIVIVNP